MGRSARVREAAAFLTRLRHNVAGNVAAITAASLVPLIALVGGGVDLSRMYLAKVRLQHACDAGALAGRKAMGAGKWDQNTNPTPEKIAEQFFNGNFKDGSYGTTTIKPVSFDENGGEVTGEVKVSVPMTLMGFFKVSAKQITVDCSAQMQIPNTDVMFVLDNTGSMADLIPGDTDSKIDTLKYAVDCFYEAVTQLNTNSGCPAGTSTGNGVNTSSQIRFGFVPYNTNVNVGRLLPTSWFADKWTYQSRIGQWWVVRNVSQPSSQSGSLQDNNGGADCNPAGASKYGFAGTTNTYSKDSGNPIVNADDYNVWKKVEKVASNMSYDSKAKTCSGTVTTTTTMYDLRETNAPAAASVFERWHYTKIEQDVSGLKNGSSWNSGLTLRTGAGGASEYMAWDGCIEERQTVKATKYYPVPSGALDLDIKSTPSGTNSYWKPALPGLVYPRQGSVDGKGNPSPNAYATDDVYTTDDYKSVADLNNSYYCPKAVAQKLQIWNEPKKFVDYVKNMTPNGNTHHDIGMLWGARLMSPDGIFKNENALTPAGGDIQRHMIFMTDGDAVVTPCNYDAYGMAFFDQRTTTDVGPATNCNAARAALNDQVNARLSALCTIVKNKQINLYVISFGGTKISAATKKRLQDCASGDDHYYDAGSSDELKAAFSKIAAQISQLRLVQ